MKSPSLKQIIFSQMMKNILLSQTKNKNELTEKTKNCTYALIVNNDVYNPIAGHIKYHDNYV